jgi:hypothetical protein
MSNNDYKTSLSNYNQQTHIDDEKINNNYFYLFKIKNNNFKELGESQLVRAFSYIKNNPRFSWFLGVMISAFLNNSIAMTFEGRIDYGLNYIINSNNDFNKILFLKKSLFYIELMHIYFKNYHDFRHLRGQPDYALISFFIPALFHGMVEFLKGHHMKHEAPEHEPNQAGINSYWRSFDSVKEQFIKRFKFLRNLEMTRRNNQQ